MSKMTDEQIKKALECCSKSSWIFDCEGCPCYDEKEDIQTSECQERLMQNALDLINRQKAEIEWKTTYMHSLQVSMEEIKPQIKSEAIKEFDRKIKVHAYYIDFPKRHRVVDEDDIDNLVKEMAGEGK